MRGFENVTYIKGGILPQRATAYSAGYDIYSVEDLVIPPSAIVLVKTGIKAYMENDEYLQLQLRSSIATKTLCIMPNSPGIIDADYYNNCENEGHILVPIFNLNAIKTIGISKGMKIAQGIFMKYLTIENDIPVKLTRTGGLGSTE